MCSSDGAAGTRPASSQLPQAPHATRRGALQDSQAARTHCSLGEAPGPGEGYGVAEDRRGASTDNDTPCVRGSVRSRPGPGRTWTWTPSAPPNPLRRVAGVASECQSRVRQDRDLRPVSQPCQEDTVSGAAPAPPVLQIGCSRLGLYTLRSHSALFFSHTLAQVQQQLTTHRDARCSLGRPPQDLPPESVARSGDAVVCVSQGSQGGAPQTRTHRRCTRRRNNSLPRFGGRVLSVDASARRRPGRLQCLARPILLRESEQQSLSSTPSVVSASRREASFMKRYVQARSG